MIFRGGRIVRLTRDLNLIALGNEHCGLYLCVALVREHQAGNVCVVDELTETSIATSTSHDCLSVLLAGEKVLRGFIETGFDM